MDNLNNNLTITKNTDPTHIFEALPKEITVKIFGYLERKSFFAACSSCKLLNEIADASPLWKEEIKFFKINVKEHIKKNISIRVTIGKCIMQLQVCAKEGDKLLDKEAKTALDLDVMAYRLMTSPQAHKVNPLFTKLYDEEVNYKFKMSEIINKGFQASLKLKHLGLRSITILEKYAVVLLKYHESGEKAWKTVALEYLSENNPKRAISIINNEIKGSNQAGFIIEAVVMHYARKKLFTEAIEIVKLYKEKNINSEKDHLDKCCSFILYWAQKFEDFFSIEQVIDTCLPEQTKFIRVVILIEKYLDLKNFKDADRFFLKYTNIIASCENKYAVHRAIELYVKCRYIDLAWEMALKHQEKDDLVLSVLGTAFSFSNLIEEEEKVQKMIDDNK